MLQQRITNLIDGNFNSINYDWVNYNEISNSAKLAVIAAEDQKFFDHYGFDFESIEKALKRNKRSKITRGASTLRSRPQKFIFMV